MMENKKSVFETLSAINVNEHTEQKGGLTYLSWAWAWHTVKTYYPNAQYKIYENESWFNYHTDGCTGWVKVGTTIEGEEHIEYLPIMDFKNKSIPIDKITSTDVNKAIQRALTKSLARHGLGLYIYAGEDLPEPPKDEPLSPEQAKEIHTLIKTAENLDMKAFLEFAQADSVENILAPLFPKLKKMLQQKQPKGGK